jgi:hypothetical protein
MHYEKSQEITTDVSQTMLCGLLSRSWRVYMEPETIKDAAWNEQEVLATCEA